MIRMYIQDDKQFIFSILSGKSAKPASAKQKLLRIYFLNILRKMPMGRQSHPRFFSRDQNLVFAQERELLIESVREFPLYTGNINSGHPVFGRMKKRDWGRFVWIHLDHHLRQFGV